MEEGSAIGSFSVPVRKNSRLVAGRTCIEIPERREGPPVRPLLSAVALLAFLN